VGANSTIDRPAVGETRIGAGTKIDNLVMVAHGVHVGRNVMLVAQVGVAGSTTIGDSSSWRGRWRGRPPHHRQGHAGHGADGHSELGPENSLISGYRHRQP